MSGNVFDKLTDKSQYTGTHVNHNEAKVVKENDTVDKHAGCHAKGFSEAPVQKFGLQVEKPSKIVLWNGLDKHAQGQKVVCTSFRTMDQLLAKACQVCSVSPQPTHLHTPHGKAVKHLTDLEDGKNYIVIQSGAKYNKASMPTALKKEEDIA
eukprot:NODE_8298_length_710_cov_135.473595_g8044_i0.p1 GENE.NODE_8298_length_710_cov_135.473595_g8044_i0~~NODE_8298_length_710_cov_135.473595_g8044_i0.p1  ORF type:complete len:152 (+),score=46.21 NODE_8298_length_710_cov_135.473595_g8044_i0:74-529(+)